MDQGSDHGRRADDLRQSRPRHAGNLGGLWRLSADGLDPGQPGGRVLGRRQAQPDRSRWRGGPGHPLPDRRHAHRGRCAASGDRGGARQFREQDPQIRHPFARRPSDRVRKPGPALCAERCGRHCAAADERERRAGIVADVVARWRADRLRALDG